jgi:carbamoyl-phosphate synthase large subunit
LAFNEKLRVPTTERVFYVADALRAGYTVDALYELTKIDRWFLHNMKEIVDTERALAKNKELSCSQLREAKEYGFSDRQIARLKGISEEEILAFRKIHNIVPEYKLVDTCAAEFQAFTPYYYSTYDR